MTLTRRGKHALALGSAREFAGLLPFGLPFFPPTPPFLARARPTCQGAVDGHAKPAHHEEAFPLRQFLRSGNILRSFMNDVVAPRPSARTAEDFYAGGGERRRKAGMKAALTGQNMKRMRRGKSFPPFITSPTTTSFSPSHALVAGE